MNVPQKDTHLRKAFTEKYKNVERVLKSKKHFNYLGFMDVQVREIPDHLRKEELIDYHAEKIFGEAKEKGFKVKTRCPKLKGFLKRNPDYMEVCI